MLLSCGLGLLLLSLSTVVAVVAGFSAESTRGAEAIFVLALISGCSAIVLILLDLMIAYLGAFEAPSEEAASGGQDQLTAAPPRRA